jgi:hypothetical protein
LIPKAGVMSIATSQGRGNEAVSNPRDTLPKLTFASGEMGELTSLPPMPMPMPVPSVLKNGWTDPEALLSTLIIPLTILSEALR